MKKQHIAVLAALGVFCVAAVCAYAYRIEGSQWRVDYNVITAPSGGTLTLTGATIVGGSASNLTLIGNTFTGGSVTNATLINSTFRGGSVTNATLTGNTITGGTVSGSSVTNVAIVNPSSIIAGGASGLTTNITVLSPDAVTNVLSFVHGLLTGFAPAE